MSWLKEAKWPLPPVVLRVGKESSLWLKEIRHQYG